MAKKPTIKELQAQVKSAEEEMAVMRQGHARQIGALTSEKQAVQTEVNTKQYRINNLEGIVATLKTQLADALEELATYRGYVQRALEDDAVREAPEQIPVVDMGWQKQTFDMGVNTAPAPTRPTRNGPSVPYRDNGPSRGMYGEERPASTPWHNL